VWPPSVCSWRRRPSLLLTQYNCVGTQKSSRVQKILAAVWRPQNDAQLVELLALDVDGERCWGVERLVDLRRSSRRGKPSAKTRLIADLFGSRRESEDWE
jgi:hypothetical protein